MKHYMNPSPRAIGQLLLCLLLSINILAPLSAQKLKKTNTALNEQTSITTLQTEDAYLLGVSEITINGVSVSSPKTVLRPIFAQDFGNERKVMQLFKVKSQEVKNGEFRLELEIFANDSEAATRSVFVMKGAVAQAKAEDPEALRPWRLDAEQAGEKLKAMVNLTETMKKHLMEIAELEEKAEGKTRDARRSGKMLNRLKKQSPRIEREARKALVESNAQAKAYADTISKWNKAINAYAVKHHARIHKDFWGHSHFRMPSEISTVQAMTATIEQFKKDAKPVGTMTWTFKPYQKNVGGWHWEGLSYDAEVKLNQELRVNAIRWMGTWELDGHVRDGLTVVAHRYRGLGPIEQTLTTNDKGEANEAWTTTEILPGAAGGGQLISPVVPSSRSVNDRGYALKHRAGAWIARLARGAGANFIDYQYRADRALARFHPSQGNIRAMTEVLPGDVTIGQTDEEYFDVGNKLKTKPMIVLVLKTPEKMAMHESRTRYLEMRQHVRKVVSEELGFIEREARPAVGYNFDYAWGARTGHMAGNMEKMAGQGVRLIMAHQPGWVNGRGMRETKHERAKDAVGSDCSIWDWVPMESVKENWIAMQKVAEKYQMPYYVWVGAYNQAKGPFIQTLGLENPQRFTSEKQVEGGAAQFDAVLPGARGLLPFNPRNEFTLNLYKQRMAGAARDYGFQGYWNDSFQSNNMTRINWTDGKGRTSQKEWWEFIAEQSQKGIDFMSESHAFPGLTCSVEVPNWQKDTWSFVNTVKWMRGPSQGSVSLEDRMDWAFRLAAVRGALAPELAGKEGLPEQVIPEYGRISRQYNAVVEDMRRLYFTKGMKASLWLPYGVEGEGVLFALEDSELPEGVQAVILDEYGQPSETVSSFKKYQVYRLKGDGLRKTFGLTLNPEEDPRDTWTYESPTYQWPAHTK